MLMIKKSLAFVLNSCQQNILKINRHLFLHRGGKNHMSQTITYIKFACITVLAAVLAIVYTNRNNEIKAQIFKPTEKQTKNIERNMPKILRSIEDINKEFFPENIRPSFYPNKFYIVNDDVERATLLRRAFIHSLHSYRRYCWGHDMIKPIDHSCDDFLHGGQFIFDSLTDIIIMNLSHLLANVNNFLQHDFSLHGSWSMSEFIHTYIGSLVSAYQMTANTLYKDIAVSMANAILPVLNDNDGLFSSGFTISTFDESFAASSKYNSYVLSEVGSYQLEFAALTQITGDPKYLEVSLKALKKIWGKNENPGVLGDSIGEGESNYYETLINLYILTGQKYEKLFNSYQNAISDIKKSFIFETKNKLIGIGYKKNGELVKINSQYTDYVPGMLVVGSINHSTSAKEDIDYAKKMISFQKEARKFTKSRLMPEQIKEKAESREDELLMETVIDQYNLNPQSAKSNYLMWRITGSNAYREIAWDMFTAINESCFTTYGFGRAKNLNSKPIIQNYQDAHFISQTLKYLYLTFSDSRKLMLYDWVFSSGGNPLRIWNSSTIHKFSYLFE